MSEIIFHLTDLLCKIALNSVEAFYLFAAIIYNAMLAFNVKIPSIIIQILKIHIYQL